MMRKRPHVYSVVGARPQFIKLAPLAPALTRRFRHTIIHTGQHYDQNMSGVFFRQLKIPKASLNLSIGGVNHGAMTGRMLEELEKLFVRHRPDAVIVYGDTNTTLAGALAAVKLSIPVAHVEAGLRSHIRDMPEEINRRMTDHVARLLFCPTKTSLQNLRREGVKEGLVLSGDLMYELLHRSRKAIERNISVLKKNSLQAGEFGLLTFHRASNTESRENLQKLCDILESSPCPILFPIHPRTRKKFHEFRMWSKLSAIDGLVLTDPLDYLDTLSAAHHARFVMTDSGGLQKEAIFLGTPVLTLRDETEWVELLRKGNRLVGLDITKIKSAWKRRKLVGKMEYRINRRLPSEIIASGLANFLKGI